ncbi:Ribosomal large subunit pseudouridine synthase D [hydrothermal vent metagenome]|uniref:Ribosomal large subunit pseudouridine synthase D n=1 Tax=hydrothermal vent metagenome TaxID=652676 RepID=A0A3B0TFU3_9ZZZZ
MPSLSNPGPAPLPAQAQIITVEVTPDDEGQRLDRFLAAALPDISRSRIAGLIRKGHLSGAGGTIGEPSRRVKPDEIFQLTVPPPEPAAPQPQAIALDIVYEDDALIVIDKPVGLVVHPAPGHDSGTLVNALLAHCGASLSGIGGVRRPGIVHRLDKDTSGLLVVAKTDAAHQALSNQFADHGRTGPLERAYLAFVWGAPGRATGVIDKPLGRHPNDRLRQAVRMRDGREAITHFRRLETFGVDRGVKPLAALMRCRLETGRTHQIRVHMTAVGSPLIGDDLYGRGHRTKAARLPGLARTHVEALDRQALHAELLVFAHPDDARIMRFESPLPADLLALHQTLKKI